MCEFHLILLLLLLLMWLLLSFMCTAIHCKQSFILFLFYTYMYTHMYGCVYFYVCVCVYVCVHIYIYIHIHVTVFNILFYFIVGRVFAFILVILIVGTM